jgi:hypothetical protein
MEFRGIVMPTPQVSSIVAHLVERVKNTRVEEQPFQHFYIEGILPDDVYRQVRSNLPGSSSYLPFNKQRWRNDKGESTRDRLCLSEGELDRIEGDKRTFWEAITTAFESEPFRLAVYDKLSGDIAIRLGCSREAVTKQEAFPNVMLLRDYKNYRIKPHPDGQPRVVTMQFYLPDEGSRDDLGTSLYVKQPLPQRLLGNKYKEIKRFPFKPNSAYAIAVNDCPERQSYHGRELITEDNTVRDSIIITWLSQKAMLGQKHAA